MTYTLIMPRTPKPYRLSSRITEECRVLINTMMQKWGATEASIIERAVREYAKKEGIALPKTGDSPPPADEP